MRLAGKRAFVTAAGQGIGRAIATAYLREGAQVTATDIRPALLDGLDGAERFGLDVTDRAALTAAIRALEALRRPCEVLLVTDSEYLRRGITEWLPGWKQRGWRTASKTPVKNVDLWQQLDALNSRHRITWQWTRGHNGNPGNERADALARQAIDELRA